MKILYLSNSFPLISETFVLYEIADLIKAGADIRILSLAKPSDAARSSLPRELGFEDRIIYCADLNRGKLSRLLRMLHLKSQGIKLPKGDKDFSRHKLMEIAAALKNINWTPDIIHCHFGPTGKLGAVLKKNAMTNALLTTIFHGFDVSQLLKEKNSDYYDDLFHAGDHFFSINEYYLKIIRDLGAPFEKTSLFHMGVDCDALPFSPRSCPAEGTIELISVGRMTEKKGFETTIKSFAKALSQKPDMRLNLIGNGPLLENVQSLAGNLGIADKVIFHGALQHTQVQELLSRSHVFLLPSVTAENGDMEGIPVALMEAMALGMPVISTYHSGIPELIEDNISGFLVAEKDDAALSEKLIHLLNHPEIWQHITLAARRRVEAEFNRKIQSEMLFDRFKQLAEKNV